MRWAAAKALGVFGRDGLPAMSRLLEACEDPGHHEIRFWALGSVTAIGQHLTPPQREYLAQELIRMVGVPVSKYDWMGSALGSIATAHEVPDILPLLDSEDRHTRLAAIYALGLIGPDARQALPTLKTIQKDAQHHTKMIVDWAVEVIEY